MEHVFSWNHSTFCFYVQERLKILWTVGELTIFNQKQDLTTVLLQLMLSYVNSSS